MILKRFFIIFGFFVMGAMLLNRHVPEPLTWSEDSGELLYALAMLSFVSFLMAGSWERFQTDALRKTLRHAGIWLGIFMVVAVGHSYRFELARIRDRVLGNLLPGRNIEEQPGMMRFQISPNGHFYIKALINGVPVRFLVDTGATDIVITPKTARRLGFDPEQLRFDRFYQTANGPGRGASVRLDELRIGALSLSDVRASVNEAPMSNSLLGMSFFNRLRGYTVQEGVLTLYW